MSACVFAVRAFGEMLQQQQRSDDSTDNLQYWKQHQRFRSPKILERRKDERVVTVRAYYVLHTVVSRNVLYVSF